MRADNVILAIVCVPAMLYAASIAWRGRSLPITSSAPPDESVEAAVRQSARDVTTTLSAGAIAGVLTAGLGGRFVMRLLAATSGDGAQGRLTEAEEVVGEITFDGTAFFVLFAGLVVPTFLSLLYLLLRRMLPNTAWKAGLLVGVLVLGTIGVNDPLSAENGDFQILAPTWLAITSVVVVGLLFGVTFTALSARFDAKSRSSVPGERPGRRILMNASAVFLINPVSLVLATAYVAAHLKPRNGPCAVNPGPGWLRAGRTTMLLVALIAVWSIGTTISKIA